MWLERKDKARLWDMLDAAQAIMDFTQGQSFADLLKQRMLRNAIERNLEIIGEAARRVTQETRDKCPNIPWRSIIALRNVLAHEYGDIHYERLWRVCTDDLEVLISAIKDLDVEHLPDEDGMTETTS